MINLKKTLLTRLVTILRVFLKTSFIKAILSVNISVLLLIRIVTPSPRIIFEVLLYLHRYYWSRRCQLHAVSLEWVLVRPQVVKRATSNWSPPRGGSISCSRFEPSERFIELELLSLKRSRLIKPELFLKRRFNREKLPFWINHAPKRLSTQ